MAETRLRSRTMFSQVPLSIGVFHPNERPVIVGVGAGSAREGVISVGLVLGAPWDGVKQASDEQGEGSRLRNLLGETPRRWAHQVALKLVRLAPFCFEQYDVLMTVNLTVGGGRSEGSTSSLDRVTLCFPAPNTHPYLRSLRLANPVLERYKTPGNGMARILSAADSASQGSRPPLKRRSPPALPCK